MDILAFVEINRAAMLFTSASLIALWPFFRKNKKQKSDHHPLQVVAKFFNVDSFSLKKGDKQDKVSRYFFDQQEIATLDTAINKLLTDKKPFLRKKYSVTDLAGEVNVPVFYLSGFINRYYKMHFTELINRYRVAYCIAMITNEEWKRKKLSAIASEAGFNNRNTFSAAFKKETGRTPSDYLNEIKRNQNNIKQQLNSNEAKKIV